MLPLALLRRERTIQLLLGEEKKSITQRGSELIDYFIAALPLWFFLPQLLSASGIRGFVSQHGLTRTAMCPALQGCCTLIRFLTKFLHIVLPFQGIFHPAALLSWPAGPASCQSSVKESEPRGGFVPWVSDCGPLGVWGTQTTPSLYLEGKYLFITLNPYFPFFLQCFITLTHL